MCDMYIQDMYKEILISKGEILMWIQAVWFNII